MVKYEDLNITQKRLYNELKDEKSKDVGIVIAKFGPNDFLPVLTAIDDQGYTLLGSFESLTLYKLKSLLCSFRVHVFLDEVVNAKTFSSKKGDEVKSISLLECVTDPNCNQVKVLRTIDVIVGLSSFWKVISEDDRERIKTKLNENGHKDVLGRIARIEEIIRTESQEVQTNNTADDNLSETSSLFSSDGDDDMEDKNKPVSKAIVAGAICGVIAGLAVGGGLFAAGVALPILALIGIAVAAALVTGLVAGGITYVISSKIENPDTSRLKKEQDLQPN